MFFIIGFHPTSPANSMFRDPLKNNYQIYGIDSMVILHSQKNEQHLLNMFMGSTWQDAQMRLWGKASGLLSSKEQQKPSLQ